MTRLIHKDKRFFDKWFITFIDADGQNNGGLTNDTDQLPAFIDKIRAMGAKQIVIHDHNPWFYDKE
jgi:hypothetical protein